MKNKTKLFLSSSIIYLAGFNLASAEIIQPKIITATPGNINISSGGFIYNPVDFTVGTLYLQRSHLNSDQDPNKTPFGVHMTSNFDIYVSPNYKTASPPLLPARYRPIVHLGLSSSGSYYKTINQVLNNNFRFTPNNDEGGSGELMWVNGAYQYTNQRGMIHSFSPIALASGVSGQGSMPAQKIDRILEPNGHLINFYYNASSQLKEVADNYGFAIVFDYDPNGQVTAACGFNLSTYYATPTSTCTSAEVKATYTYVGNANSSKLVSISAPDNSVTNLGWLSHINCVKPPGYSSCKISTSGGGIISQQTLGNGSVWQFAYDGDNTNLYDPDGAPSDGGNQVYVTDPEGNTSFYTFSRHSPYSFTDPKGRVTSYRFSGASGYDVVNATTTTDGTLLKSLTLPEGQKLEMTYGVFNSLVKTKEIAKPGSGLPDKIESMTYSNACPSGHPHPFCTSPTSKTDAKGNVTDYTYDPIHGGVLTETLPSDIQGVRPQTRYAYSQFYAKIFNSSGVLVNSSSPITKLVKTSTCRTATPTDPAFCVGTVNEIVTEYEYNHPNLWKTAETTRSGDNSISRRATFTYDNVGNLTSVDGPRTDVIDIGYFTYDIMRRKIFEIGVDPDGNGPLPRQIVKHIYDLEGRENRTETGTGTAINGSDFIPKTFTRRTFNGVDQVIKTETGTP